MSTENINNEENKESVLGEQYDEIRAIEIEGYELGVKKARNALFLTAGLLFVGEMIALWQLQIGFENLPMLTWLIIALEVGVFIGLALWTKKQPYTSIVIGIAAFFAIWILSIVANGAIGAYGGIIIKAIILSNLFRSLKDAKALQEARKEGL